MRLAELMEGLESGGFSPEAGAVQVTDIFEDSRQVTPGSVFVAVAGTAGNGNTYVADALKRGAGVIVSEENLALDTAEAVALTVADSRRCLRSMLDRYYGPDVRKVNVIGVTGTNGKTTCTYLLESVLSRAGKRCGVVGTINSRLGAVVRPARNTTPGLADNYRFLSQIVQEGADYCVMEVSSHGLDQGRVDGISFSTAILTNVTQDHLDYHKDMESYFQAKARLFLPPASVGRAVVNIDDLYGRRLAAMVPDTVLTYGLKEEAAVTARDVRTSLAGSRFMVHGPQGDFPVCPSLVGRHNVYNVLAACAAGLSEGIPVPLIQEGIQFCPAVPGRLQPVACGQDFYVFVDYAHTDDALENILSAVRPLTSAKVILVFGCGGDRDKGKRPQMGRVASRLADFTVITNDNPRGEDPVEIMGQITAGFSHDRFTVVPDRKEAIALAVNMAGGGDVVIVAGKGHENYQIFKERTIEFDDSAVVKGCLQQRLQKR